MVRRVASQVHQQVSRLMRGNYIKREPAWFGAILEYPPLPLPAKAPPSRTKYDQPLNQTGKAPKRQNYDPKPLPIHYLEDDIRRQFFRDHPFEAFRPSTLVESGTIAEEHPVRGKGWTRLRQRGRNPKPEDCVKFAVNLYEHHDVPLAQAYTTAVAQFRALRSEQHIATQFAVIEAKKLGAVFGSSQIQKTFAREMKALSTFHKKAEMDESALAARKRWKAIIAREDASPEWTKGENYVRLWKEGVRPNYAAILSEPISTALTPEQIARQADFLLLGNHNKARSPAPTE